MIKIVIFSCCYMPYAVVIKNLQFVSFVESHPTTGKASAWNVLQGSAYCSHQCSVLNYFCGENGKTVAFGSDVEPAFWGFPVEVVLLKLSKDAVIGKHGDVSHITLGDVMPWHKARQLGLNPRETVQLAAKSKLKTYLLFIVELGKGSKKNGKLSTFCG